MSQGLAPDTPMMPFGLSGLKNELTEVFYMDVFLLG
jgi:hypothetical protein